MTTEEKARAYDEALKRAETAINIAADKDLVKGVATTIFPELRESEDERIRKEIRNFLIDMECKKEWIAYLEKQKYPNEDYLNNPAFLDGFDTGREVQKIFDEQKPAEWSEEDKQMIERLIRHTQEEFNELCNDRYGHQEIISDLKESCRERMNWLEKLKSLRPQPHTVSIKNATKFGNLEYERGVKDGIQYSENHRWKPSEEQMSMLRAIVNDPNNVGAESCHLAMQSLYNDLLKLKGGVAPMRDIDE